MTVPDRCNDFLINLYHQKIIKCRITRQNSFSDSEKSDSKQYRKYGQKYNQNGPVSRRTKPLKITKKSHHQSRERLNRSFDIDLSDNKSQVGNFYRQRGISGSMHDLTNPNRFQDGDGFGICMVEKDDNFQRSGYSVERRKSREFDVRASKRQNRPISMFADIQQEQHYDSLGQIMQSSHIRNSMRHLNSRPITTAQSMYAL